MGELEKVEIVEKTIETETSELEKELIAIVKEVLGEEVNVSGDDDFFIHLNASSLDYFEITTIVRDRFSLRQDVFENKGLTTVNQIASVVMEELN